MLKNYKLISISFFCFLNISASNSKFQNSIFIVIHGTWSLESVWHQTEGDFFDSVANSVAGKGGNIYTFSWSGKLSHASRIQAGTNLAYLINSYPENIEVNLIGHSHGANVGIIASHVLKNIFLGKRKIKNFYALGSPVNPRLYLPDMDIIQHYYNFYSFGDFIQPIFGLYDRVFPEHERIANLRVVLNGQEPSHSNLHDPLIGKWLPYIHQILTENKHGNFENFQFIKPGMIFFNKNISPKYILDKNYRKLAYLDKVRTKRFAKSLFRQYSLTGLSLILEKI